MEGLVVGEKKYRWKDVWVGERIERWSNGMMGRMREGMDGCPEGWVGMGMSKQMQGRKDVKCQQAATRLSWTDVADAK